MEALAAAGHRSCEQSVAGRGSSRVRQRDGPGAPETPMTLKRRFFLKSSALGATLLSDPAEVLGLLHLEPLDFVDDLLTYYPEPDWDRARPVRAPQDGQDQ